MYSSCAVGAAGEQEAAAPVQPGRTSVTVTWRSVTGAVDLSIRLRLASPTIVVSLVNAGVWKATALAAGTGVQLYGGWAAQALAVDARASAGRTAGLGR